MKYAALVKAIQTASAQFQGKAAMAVNQALVMRNWLVGAWIFEFEQYGSDRVKYGEMLLESLAKYISTKGLEIRHLRNCRLLYATYPQIRQTLSAELATPLSPQALLQLSWSHLGELIPIDEIWKRAFFENECLQANWSVRQLRRQIGSLLYERTGLSTNKKAVIEKARKQERQQDFTNLIRDPYVLEFTGLAERPEYLESDLESALLTHLQGFLLELGAGFCFEARQKRITVGRWPSARLYRPCLLPPPTPLPRPHRPENPPLQTWRCRADEFLSELVEIQRHGRRRPSTQSA